MNTDFGRSPYGFSLCISVFSVVKPAVLFQGQVNALAYNRSEFPIRVHPCSSVVGSHWIFSVSSVVKPAVGYPRSVFDGNKKIPGGCPPGMAFALGED